MNDAATPAEEATGFLYPFIEAEETDAESLLTDLAASARSKAEISRELQRSSLERMAPDIRAAGAAMGRRFLDGGRLYTFGNGGSSTDAATLAGLFCDPAYGRPVPAWSLTDDQAVVTALGNDVGFELIFSRQLIAHSTERDIAVAMSTSGNSDDLIRGLGEAHRRGLLTIGFAGYDGGQMAASDAVDFCFTVDSQSIHRIQEAQARIGHRLWVAAQETMTELRAARRLAGAGPRTQEER
jgi:D-sedoheptulose 7-phosphate isomerase